MNNQYKIRTIVCKGCEKEITKRMPKNRQYCSHKCWRTSKHPQNRTGKIFECEWCGKETYKQKSLQKKHKFCSIKCANNWQGRNKISFICKACKKEFKWSKSRLKNNNPTYCCIKCRNKDEEWIKNACIKGNLIQQKKKGLNKLELEGRKILQNIGIKFSEQILMFNKFLVDVLLENKSIVIQWDGKYWHNKPKRKNLDKSQDNYLKKCGYKVLRFTDDQIYKQKEYVIENIKRATQ